MAKILRLDLERGQYLQINMETDLVHRYDRKGRVVEMTKLTPIQKEILEEKLYEIAESEK